MSNSLPVWGPDDQPDVPAAKKRSPWRMRLIEAERGFSFGFKTSSALFGHIFLSLSIIVTAIVFGIGLVGWISLVVAMSCTIAAELFHHAVRTLAESLHQEKAEKAIKLSAAGMVMVMLAASIVIAFVLGNRLSLMLK